MLTMMMMGKERNAGIRNQMRKEDKREDDEDTTLNLEPFFLILKKTIDFRALISVPCCPLSSSLVAVCNRMNELEEEGGKEGNYSCEDTKEESGREVMMMTVSDCFPCLPLFVWLEV